MNFPFGTNGKFIILGVPILKHIRVDMAQIARFYSVIIKELMNTVMYKFSLETIYARPHYFVKLWFR